MSNPQTRGELKFADSLFKTISRLLKFFTARIPGGRVLNFPSAQAFGKYEQFFPPDAIAHPAKANSAMIEWIILRYTKPGEVVVDPMAGTFSTSVIAAINNRHGIGVELEEKFYKWGLEAKRRVEQIPTLTPKGRMVVLKGDARELSKVLKENAEVVIFSPPFASAEFDCKHGIKELGPNLKGRKVWENKQKATLGKNNIGRLQYGASAIIFSPPFGETTDNPSPPKGREDLIPYSYRRDMHGIAVGQIANLPYGTLPDGGEPEVSAVVFSPPFADVVKGAGMQREGREYIDKNGGVHGKVRPRLISADPNNIDNMPYGEADAIITSPPYSSASTSGKAGGETGRANTGEFPIGKSIRHGGYGKNKQNIGNLPHGNADAIVTSPPYDEGLGHKVGKQKITKTGITRPEYTPDYTNKAQIGNLKSNTYLGAMLQVYRECYKVLKPGGVMVLITKNFIRNKKIVRLDLDTIKLCEAAGFKFAERWYRKLEHPSFWRIIYSKKFNYCPKCVKVYRVRKATSDAPTITRCPKCGAGLKPALIEFDDILVFRKPEATMCPTCGKHELVPHLSDTLLCPECGYVKTEAEK